MKLTTLYYRHIVPTIMVLFLVSIVSALFLIRKTLRQELDGVLLRSKSRIENYVQLNGRLPDISTFNDQLIVFKPVSELREMLFNDTMQYIAEQKKKHFSHKLSFGMLLHGHPWEATISQPQKGTRHLTILISEIAIATISVTLFLFILINRLVLSKLWRPFYQSLELIDSFKLDHPIPHTYPESPVEEFT